jgi:hypothetical protein
VKSYEIDENWRIVPTTSDLSTVCPIIGDTKVMLYIGALVEFFQEFNVARSELIESPLMEFKETVTEDEPLEEINNKDYIYINPFAKKSFKLEDGQMAYARVLNGCGSIIVSETIIEGCE